MTWDDLRQLRLQGLKPSLPVIVATQGSRLCRTLTDEGCGVIYHQRGQMFPVELLDGLRVWLMVDCDDAQRVVRSFNARGARPAELRNWCACMGRMESAPVGCENALEWAA